jgi:hypothetical protein
MRQRRQESWEFRQAFSRRQGAEFRNGFVAPYEHETFATIGYTIDVFREVAGYLSHRECLRHQRSSMKKLRIILSDYALNCQRLTPSTPNAAAQPLPKAEATQERTLEAVGCSTLFGAVCGLS